MMKLVAFLGLTLAVFGEFITISVSNVAISSST